MLPSPAAQTTKPLLGGNIQVQSFQIPSEPNPTRLLFNGADRLFQMFGPNLPLCEHRPKARLTVSPPTEPSMATEPQIAEVDVITNKLEEAYIGSMDSGFQARYATIRPMKETRPYEDKTVTLETPRNLPDSNVENRHPTSSVGRERILANKGLKRQQRRSSDGGCPSGIVINERASTCSAAEENKGIATCEFLTKLILPEPFDGHPSKSAT